MFISAFHRFQIPRPCLVISLLKLAGITLINIWLLNATVEKSRGIYVVNTIGTNTVYCTTTIEN